jgi:Na+-driven multidrug efflux pump
MKVKSMLVATATLFFCMIPDPVSAYVGPGTGLAILGAALAFIASLFLGVLGFVWYPFKKVYRAIFKRGKLPSDQISP